VWAVIVGSIDQGTTGTRFTLYDDSAKSLGYSYREHRQIYPEPGWVEHDPLEILANTKLVIREAVGKAGVDPGDIGAIGVTNQRETSVIWNRKTGLPVCNAIVWQCRRTATLVEKLIEDGYGDLIRERTGLVPDAYFSGPKIWWVLDRIPGTRRAAERGELLFGNVDTWLIWSLTGLHVTDYSNASRTMLFDIHRMCWDMELMEIQGNIPEFILPEIRPSSDPSFYGHLDSSIMGAEVPICGDLGDQQAALFGQGCFYPGDAKNTYGTGNFLLMNTGHELASSSHGLLKTVAYGLPGKVAYALEGSVFTTGAVVRWLVEEARLVDSVEEIEELATSVPDTGGVHLIPAFSGVGAPHWNMYARGMIMGLNLGTTRSHLARAALESEAYRTRDLIEAMERDSGMKMERLKVDGGGSKNDFTMQFQSDILGIPVARPGTTEITSMGAAFAAGLAAGIWEGQDDLVEIIEVERAFEPQISREMGDKLYGEWRNAMNCALTCTDILGKRT
jgi:glycerol kinase